MTVSEAIKAAQKKYNAKTMVMPIRINPESESDLFDALSKQDNRSGYIKQLIRDDIARGVK